MKQGAYLDRSELYQPWIILIMNFIMDNIDKQETEGSFQPLNIGYGWSSNVLDIKRNESDTEEEARPS